MAVQRVFLVVLMLSITVSGFGNSYNELTYSCNPSGAITVLNPDPNTFVNAIAELSATQQECPILVTYLQATFVIYNCPISHNITLILLETSTRPEIFTGTGFEYHTLRCQQIPATGVYRRVTDESWVTNYVMTSVAPSVFPQILLDMELQDIESRVQRKKAAVGEPLRWEIETYANYISQPLNCTVLSGAGGEAINIVLNGCSLDSFLLTHFDYDSSSTRHILVAQLYAFRFANSNRIIIECEMLGCPDRYPNPTACDFSCPDERRRKRSQKRETRMTDGQGGDESFLGNEPDSFDAKIQTEIEVFEPQLLPLRAGYKPISSPTAALIFAVIGFILVFN